MPRTPLRTLLDRGRKAGLTTPELYSALSSRPPQVADVQADWIDCNGYRVRVDAAGHAVFRAEIRRT